MQQFIANSLLKTPFLLAIPAAAIFSIPISTTSTTFFYTLLYHRIQLLTTSIAFFYLFFPFAAQLSHFYFFMANKLLLL